MTRFWHPMADMGLVEERGELVFDRTEGSTLWDEQGRKYIDATAALWYCNVGYGRGEIADAAARRSGGSMPIRPTPTLRRARRSTSPSGSQRCLLSTTRVSS